MGIKPAPVHRVDEEQTERMAGLIAGYLRKILCKKEQEELQDWINASDGNRSLFEELTDPETIKERSQAFDRPDEKKALERLSLRLRL